MTHKDIAMTNQNLDIQALETTAKAATPDKSLGEKLFEAIAEAYGRDVEWKVQPASEQWEYEISALAFAARLSHDETASAVIADLEIRLQAAEAEVERLKTETGYLTIGRMLDAETIGELMEDGAETWRPIVEAKPELNLCIIVCTSDEPPHVGEATWLREGDGELDLWWANTSPGDYYADPISQSNAPVVAWRPMPEAPCAERAKALAKGDSRDVTYIGLTTRATTAEALAKTQAETIGELVDLLRKNAAIVQLAAEGRSIGKRDTIMFNGFWSHLGAVRVKDLLDQTDALLAKARPDTGEQSQ